MASSPWAPTIRLYTIHVPERDPTKAATRMHQAILCHLPIRQTHEEALVIERGTNDPYLESNVLWPDRFC